MDELIIILFLLEAMNHHEDPQCRVSDAEVMTTALVAACFLLRRKPVPSLPLAC